MRGSGGDARPNCVCNNNNNNNNNNINNNNNCQVTVSVKFAVRKSVSDIQSTCSAGDVRQKVVFIS